MSAAGLAALVPTIRRHAEGLAWRTGADPLEIETEALLSVWRKAERGGLALEEAGPALLYGYARNAARRCARGVQRRGSVPLDALQLAGAESPAVDLERAEVESAVRVALDALPAEARRFVALHFFEDLSVREIADQERANFFHVQASIDRSLEAMRDTLRPLASICCTLAGS